MPDDKKPERARTRRRFAALNASIFHTTPLQEAIENQTTKSESAETGDAVAAVSKSDMDDRERARVVRKSRLLGGLIYAVTRAIFRTMRVSYQGMERLHLYPPFSDTGDKPVTGAILVTWHGRTLLPANVFRSRGYWALISLSRDGEMQNDIFQRYGFQTVRGSTGRGGVRGLLQMARKVKEGGVLAFTPDGPRGPTHKMQHGVILMAEKSGVPIIPIGTSASRRWLMKSWDSYMIPKPFSRAVFLVGDQIMVPPNLDEAGRDAIAREVECALNQIEREAERLAGHSEYPAEWPTQ